MDSNIHGITSGARCVNNVYAQKTFALSYTQTGIYKRLESVHLSFRPCVHTVLADIVAGDMIRTKLNVS